MRFGTITQSLLSSADDCLRKFQYGLQRPVWVRQIASADRAVGTGYHAGLAHYYEQRIDNPSALPDKARMINAAVAVFATSIETDLYTGLPVDDFRWTDRVPDLATAHKLIGELITAYVDNEWWIGLEHTVLAVELNEQFTDPESGLVFKLGADVVTSIGTTLRLHDHKTAGKAWPQGKESPRKQNQSPLYTWAARQKWPDMERVEFAFDIITYPGPRTPVRFERRVTTPTPAHEQAVVGKAIDLLHLYQTAVVEHGRDLPANPSSTRCNPKWCDYWDGCSHGAALDGDAPLTIGSRSTFTAADIPTVDIPAPDEGADVDAATIDALKRRYMALADDIRRGFLKQLAEQAIQGNNGRGRVPYTLSDRPSLRRFEITRGLVTLAEAGVDDEETVRCIVASITGDVAHFPTVSTGQVVGMLGADEAVVFARRCDLMATTTVLSSIDEATGRVVLQFDDHEEAA